MKSTRNLFGPSHVVLQAVTYRITGSLGGEENSMTDTRLIDRVHEYERKRQSELLQRVAHSAVVSHSKNLNQLTHSGNVEDGRQLPMRSAATVLTLREATSASEVVPT